MNETASLLHNVGGPPAAFIRWNGLAGAGPAGSAGGASAAPRTGNWLHCRHHCAAGVRVDWNRSTELLELVRPGHGLREPQARRALLDAMEAHARELDWPPLLVCSTGAFAGVHPNEQLVLDHPLTAFVALGKCIGSLWMRDRPWRLAPLNTPTVVRGGGSGYPRGMQWSCRLWFPEGVPAHLLQRVRSAETNRVKR